MLNQFGKDYSENLDKFYGNNTVLVKNKTYISFKSVLDLIDTYKTQYFYDSDLEMVSSISMNLDEMQRTYYGYFKWLWNFALNEKIGDKKYEINREKKI